MPNFAVISNDTVIDIIIANSAEEAELLTGFPCIMSDIPGAGWTYDKDTKSFMEPESNLTIAFPLEGLGTDMPDPELVEVPELAPPLAE